jgi:hypothetical protein
MSRYIGFSRGIYSDKLSRRALRVPNRAERRFQRRWLDYCLVLDRGTDPAIGQIEPRPPDRREEVLAVLAKTGQSEPTTGELDDESEQIAEQPLLPFFDDKSPPIADGCSEPSVGSDQASRGELAESDFVDLLDSNTVPPQISFEWLSPVNIILSEIWRADEGAWQRRLGERFLGPLTPHASRSFANLVRAGLQPDMLAFRFHRAAEVHELAADESFIQSEIRDLETLVATMRRDFNALFGRVNQFHERLVSRQLLVLADEPGTAELNVLNADFQDWGDRFVNDQLQHLRRQLDGRRHPFRGDAEIKLSLCIHVATGAYYDADVELILNELRAVRGYPERPPGTLRKRRAYWEKRLG